jgi:hypothetical protein
VPNSTAKPGEQFVIKRQALQRIKRAFDAGARFAYPTVTIRANGAVVAPDEPAGSGQDGAAAGAGE